MESIIKPPLLAALVLATLSAQFSVTFAQGTAFTYQGRLTENGTEFTGVAEFQPTLWDSAAGGASLATNSPALVSAGVTNGIFVLPLDFGGAPFSAVAARWLQLQVRTALGSFTLLSPRQKLTPVPYALSAGSVNGTVAAAQLAGTLPNASFGGTYSSAVNLNNAANSFTGSGAGLNNVNAATLNGVTSAAFWSTNGNLGASPANGAFIGTRDNQPLEFKVWGSRALRLELSGNSPNIVGGHSLNSVSNGLIGATIAGGGSFDFPNRVGADYGAVLGGYGNTAGGPASTAMGFYTSARGPYSVAAGAEAIAIGNSSIAMGNTTTASGNGAVALGVQNTASGFRAMALGTGTTASGDSATALGSGSIASGERSTALGFITEASGGYSTAMGFGSMSRGFAATAMGRNTVAAGENSFAAGTSARAEHPGSFVWADSTGADFASTDAHQFIIRAYSGVGMGTAKPQANLHIYSDRNPTTMRIQSTGTPGFGRIEFMSNPQGDANEWRPAYIQSTDAGGFTGGLAFVVNGTEAANKFGELETMRIQNGRVGIGNNAPGTLLQVGGATCNGLTWNNSSDRNIKSNFEPIDGGRILEKIAVLPIQAWSYTNDTSTRHVGPVAQDFRAAFGLGSDDKTIATVDADGVALAAIQALNRKLQEKEARIAELETRLSAIEGLLRNDKPN